MPGSSLAPITTDRTVRFVCRGREGARQKPLDKMYDEYWGEIQANRKEADKALAEWLELLIREYDAKL